MTLVLCFSSILTIFSLLTEEAFSPFTFNVITDTFRFEHIVFTVCFLFIQLFCAYFFFMYSFGVIETFLFFSFFLVSLKVNILLLLVVPLEIITYVLISKYYVLVLLSSFLK